MAPKPRNTILRSRALDALLGSGVAALVIGAAILGDPAHLPTHKLAFGVMQGARPSPMAAIRCAGRPKSVCTGTACAGRPPCSR
jgi:hypothetical protein